MLAAALLGLAVPVAGCSSISEKLAGSMSEMPAIGLPASAPDRPAAPPTFPAVHGMPPPRAERVLNEVEQQKLEDDLVAARDQQQVIANASSKKAAKTIEPRKLAKKDTKKPPPPEQPASIPTSSSRSLY